MTLIQSCKAKTCIKAVIIQVHNGNNRVQRVQGTFITSTCDVSNPSSALKQDLVQDCTKIQDKHEILDPTSGIYL